jgi:restriction system protein
VQQTLQAAGALSWRDFSAALEDAWLREGYTVNRRHGRESDGADFALHKAGATTLVSGKRWKAASLGVEPLRELHAAVKQAEARDGIVVALGDVTPQAARFAKENTIRVLQASDLVKLLRNTRLDGASRA